MYQETEIDDDEFFDEDETDTQDDINFEEESETLLIESRGAPKGTIFNNVSSAP